TGEQRLTDVKARKRLLFQEQHAAPELSQTRGRAGTRRASADHDRVVAHATRSSSAAPKKRRIFAACARASARPTSISSCAKPPSKSRYEAQSASGCPASRLKRSKK